jgi:hypothetical protein
MMQGDDVTNDQVSEFIREHFHDVGKALATGAEDLALVVDELQRESDMLKQIAAEYKARSNTLSERAKWMKGQICAAMRLGDEVKLAGLRATITRQKNGRASLTLRPGIGPEDVDERFTKTTLEFSTTAIMEALEAGEELPWASAEKGEHVRIKLGKGAR